MVASQAMTTMEIVAVEGHHTPVVVAAVVIVADSRAVSVINYGYYLC